MWVMGIHAGWRGIENRIVPKAVSLLTRQGCDPKNLMVFVGPHIRKSSFEVGNDVRDKLLKSFSPPRKNDFYSEINNSKSYVDLELILNEQLQESLIHPANIFSENKDTVTDLNYHSFRRSKETSGRQISWISLKA